jgi:hypothetical protein
VVATATSELRAEQQRDARVTFHRVHPDAKLWEAQKGAAGTMPAAAFQFCEAMRTASAFGWYLFPLRDIYLRWDGAEVLVHLDELWQPFISLPLDHEFRDEWDEYAPADMRGDSPPYLRNLFVPGVVQVWTGLFVSTAPDWSISIRPVVNVPRPVSYQCYEGIIETDEFRCTPLFVNIRLIDTEHPIFFNRDLPLFQVQAIHRSCYSAETQRYRAFDGIRPRLDGIAGMSPADWDDHRESTRPPDPEDNPEPVGSYGARARRRARRETSG